MMILCLTFMKISVLTTTKPVEAGQHEHDNIMEKITINYKHAGKWKNLTLHKNADLDKAMQQSNKYSLEKDGCLKFAWMMMILCFVFIKI